MSLLSGSSDEDPQAILDDHLSRVLKTPGCQSPAIVRHSPRSSSPEHKSLARTGFGIKALVRTGPSASCVTSADQRGITLALGPSRTLVSRQSTKHIHHHYIHHHATPKTTEQIEREAALRVHGLCSSGSECPPYQRSRSLGREMCGAVSMDSGLGSVLLIFMSLNLVFCLLLCIKPHTLPFPFAGVPALCPGVPVAWGLRTAQQRGAWRTVGPLSCPATQQTPPRTCCSGSWKVNGKAGISLTGKPKCPGFKTGFILIHKLDMLLNLSSPPPAQQPEHQEILRGLLHADAHVGWWRKLWPPAQPPARPAVHPGPSHASSTSPQHSGPAGGGLPPTGGGLHQDHQATVHRHRTVSVLDRRDS